MLIKQLSYFLFVALTVAAVNATAASNKKEQQAITDQKIKLSALQAIKNANRLIVDASFPEINRLQIYLSHGQGKFFTLEKMTSVIDGQDKIITSYNKAEQQALLRGGSKRIYTGVLAEGIHELVVVFYGHDRRGNVVQKAQNWLFDKKPGAVIAVINVADNEAAHRPDFNFKIIQGEQ
ncbi:MAG: hypothetical protein OEY11_05700 [Gammaproteobacteria bacterium]|nr:hypothetical protein [Gammaproteobacteria bacterium]